MPEPSDSVNEQARALMAAGHKIEAIKLVRAETGYSLLEAKNHVEALAGQDPASASMSGGDFEQELVALLRQGNKIEAIRYFRQETGAGLKEAHDNVRELAGRHGIAWSGGPGCLGVVLAAGGLALLLLG